MKVPMQEHGHAGIADKPSREFVAPSESVNRHRASHRLATPAVPLDPVLEDELNPRRERHHAVRDDRRAAAMQAADEVRDVIELNSGAPLRERSLAWDGLKQQRAQRCVIAPHERYPPRGLPAPKRRRFRDPKFRLGRELENRGATVGASASDHQRGIAAPDGVTEDQLPALRELSENSGEPFPPRLDSRSKSSEETTTTRVKRRRGEVHATTMPRAPRRMGETLLRLPRCDGVITPQCDAGSRLLAVFWLVGVGFFGFVTGPEPTTERWASYLLASIAVGSVIVELILRIRISVMTRRRLSPTRAVVAGLGALVPALAAITMITLTQTGNDEIVFMSGVMLSTGVGVICAQALSEAPAED